MKSNLHRYHVDLHSHSRFSADGVAEPEDMIAVARQKGLHGFAITDHNTCDCVDYFLEKGFMREDGEPVDDFLIIPGQEITTHAGHLLALGVHLPDLKGIDPVEACHRIHELGGLAVPAHPYDYFRAGIREAVLDTLPMDGIEVFNAATSFKRCNSRAFAYAQSHGIPMTAGSDAHDAAVIGTAYTIVETEAFNVKSVLEAVKTHTDLEQRYLTPKEAFKKTWNNMLRFKKRGKTTTSA